MFDPEVDSLPEKLAEARRYAKRAGCEDEIQHILDQFNISAEAVHTLDQLEPKEQKRIAAALQVIINDFAPDYW